MDGGLWRRTWRHDRPALAVTGAAALLASIGWRAITRPMGDTPSYRATAAILRDGWGSITERGPGYPLLLVLTGADDRSSRVLFLAQLALHVAAIVLVVDLARRADVGRFGRTALALLLVAPPVLLRVVYEATEALAALLVTAIAWLLLTPPEPGRRVRWAVALGLLCGGAGLTRPNLAVLVVPVAVVVAVRVGGADGRRAAIAVAGPAMLLIGGLAVANGLRFDSYGLTPLTPYHLNAKTAPYVEELPERFEPGRSVLIEARDAALLHGGSSAPDNYIWDARPALEEATGLRGRALDRWVLAVDRHLIAHHPLDYLDTVEAASLRYVQMDSQPAVQGLGRPIAQLEQLLHLGLLAVTVALVSLVPGLALAGQVARRPWQSWVVAMLLSASTWLSAVTTESGTARLRAPVEPLLALGVVVSASVVRRAWRSRPARRGTA
ncbi:MAG: glycosyltransferase family 39 protein [Acidimicrobiales bacterium]|nr:glycosyltransferase family 39 protein [Acidimicrobiales bacterium]